MQTTINDPRIIACQDALELDLSIRAIEDIEREKLRSLERVLGTLWTAEDFAKAKKQEDQLALLDDGEQTEQPKHKFDELRFPLATLINPKVVESARDQLAVQEGLKQTDVPEGTESLFDLPKDEFLKRMEGAVNYASKGRSRPTDPNKGRNG